MVDQSRRTFLKASVATTGGLMLGTSLSTPAHDAHNNENLEKWQPDAWLTIHPDNHIELTLARVEMGQGTITGITTLMSEELDVAPENINVVFAPPGKTYVNPKFRVQLTGGSNSIATSWLPIRKAGASARAMLLKAAADTWSVNPDECITLNGKVFHSSGKELSYGELALEAAMGFPPENITLKKPSEFKRIGQQNSRLDAQEKVLGKTVYGIDVNVPNMLHAVVIRPPAYGSTLKAADTRKASAISGVRHIFEIDQGIAIVADRYWQARKAEETILIQWNENYSITESTESLFKLYDAALTRDEGRTVRSEGNIETAFDQTGVTLTSEYRCPLLAHATMEPQNCVAYVQEDRCDIWAPTQGPDVARGVAARILDLDQDQIFVQTTFLGGGFGRRIVQDYVKEAVGISNKIKKPVKVVWSREDDTRHDQYRPASLHRLSASVNSNGTASAWYHRIAAPKLMDWSLDDIATAVVPSAPKWTYGLTARAAKMASDATDTSPYEGANDLPYSIENIKVDYVHADPGVPVNYWRSVGHSHNGFVTESFVDELAHSARQDPFQFRMNLLSEYPKAQTVLKMTAEKADWGRSDKSSSQGIAIHKSFDTWVAQVAEVTVQGNQFTVKKVTCVVDCGTAVNPDIIKAQMEGGINFALTAALYGEITLKNGQVQESNFHDYQILRINEAPEIEVFIVESDASPTGVGEPGVPPLAPAVANALFAATGQRLRTLPLKLA